MTGIGFNTGQLTEKRLQILHELVPKATVITVLVASDNPAAASQVRRAQDAARPLGLQLNVLQVRTEREIDTAFAALGNERVRALLVGNDGFFVARRDQFAAL